MLRFSRSKVKPLLIKIFSVIAILLILARIFLFPKETSAVWFDDNYGYRQKATIGNTGAADSNKKVKFDIDTATLISSGKMTSTCADTRFTDGNGKALQYYLDASGGACNTSSTDFYVLIPTINGSSNDTYIYMYYGYASAVSASSASQLPVATFSPTSGPTLATEEKGTTPVLYWKFDEGTGTTAYDATQNANNGTFGASTAAPTVLMEDQCVSGKCLKFNGSEDYVSRTYSSDSELDPGSESFTVSAWFKHTSIEADERHTIISRINAGGGYKVYMRNTEVVCFGIDTSSFTPDDEACSTATYNDSKWHMVEALKNGTSSIEIYIDGKKVGEDTSLTVAGSSLSGTSTPIYVGANNGGGSEYFDGNIDEVKVYAYARSANQIKTDFLNRSSGDSIAATLGAADQQSLSTGLVGYWKMDESAINGCVGGTNDACDSSGNGNDGAYNGDAAAAAGKFNKGVTFDGTGDYISVPDSTSLDASTSVTVAAWIYVDSYTSSYPRIITKGSAYDLHMYVFGGGEGRLEWDIRIPGETDTTTPVSAAVPLNQWTHVAATYDGSSSKIYVNGKLQSQLNGLSGSITNTNNALGIGAIATGSNYFPGDIDEARVYNRALSDMEIQALYDWAPGPVGWWNMDENTGSSANDSSGNGNVITLPSNPNTPAWKNGKMGHALYFDGTNDYATAADSSSLDITGAVTVEAWVYPTDIDASSGYQTIILKDSFGGNQENYGLQFANDKLDFNFHDGTNYREYFSTTTFTNNHWYHVAATYNDASNEVKLYINGALDSTQSSTFTMITDNQLLHFASSDTGSNENYTGYIDDVKIYNYTLSAKQIVSSMNASHPAVGSPVGSAVAYWNFDEGYGTTANDSYANSNSLTLNTASWATTGKFGKAWNGDGTNWVTRANDDDFNFAATDDFSISMWVKSDTAATPATQEYLLSKAESSPGYRIFGQTDGDIVFGIDDDSSWTPGDKVGDTGTNNRYDGNWHHVVATKTGISRLDLYIDGTLIQSDTSIAGTATLTNSVALYIGDRNGVNGGDEFNGDIDEVKIYRYALNIDEVRLEYNQGKAQVMGAISTESNGTTASFSTNREYCIPGDTTSCDTPAHLWSFDEGTGATGNDTGSSPLAVTLANGVEWKAGKVGKSLSFDGCSGCAQDDSTSVASLTLPTVMTLEAWVYPTTTGEGGLGRILDNTSDITLFVNSSNANRLEFSAVWSSVNGNWYATPAMSYNQWNHVAVTYDYGSTSNTPTFYVNGVKQTTNVGSGSPSGTHSLTAHTLYIGNNSTGTRTWDGYIDSVKMFNYARTAAQIAWDYNRGAPVGWWKFDECQGTTAYDASGNSSNGTITPGNNTGDNDTAGTCSSGTTTEMWNDGTTGKYNSSLDFDGTNDYVDMGDRDILNAITVSAWIYWDAVTTNDGIVSKRTGTEAAGDWAFRMSDNGDGKLEWMVWSGVDSSNNDYSIGTISTGAWHHVAVTFDNSNNNTKFYIDGVLDSTDTSGTNDIADTSETLKIGSAGQSSDFFDGRIDDVRIYNYPLTAAQIKTTYNDGSSVRFGPDTGSP